MFKRLIKIYLISALYSPIYGMDEIKENVTKAEKISSERTEIEDSIWQDLTIETKATMSYQSIFDFLLNANSEIEETSRSNKEDIDPNIFEKNCNFLTEKKMEGEYFQDQYLEEIRGQTAYDKEIVPMDFGTYLEQKNTFVCQMLEHGDGKQDNSTTIDSNSIQISEKKLYSCNFEDCSKSFSRKSDLTRHKTTHSNTKAHSCNHKNCDKSFHRKCDLIRHERTHTGEKPYICDEADCYARFSDQSDLVKHKRKHTGEKPYQCDESGCFKGFSDKSNLNAHKRRHAKRKKKLLQAKSNKKRKK